MRAIKQKISTESDLPHKHLNLLGKQIYIYRQISSTNNVAKYLAQSGAPEGTMVITTYQSSGKGRMHRQWVCPSSRGLLMSIIIRPKINTQFVPQLTLLTGVVVAESIKRATGCAAGIKWPNDIVIGRKKMCGILAESSFSGSGLDHVIIGTGINVNLDTADLPPDCLETSTSLMLELGHRVSRYKLLKQFIITWEEYYQGFLQGGHDYLRKHWINNNVTLGRRVIISKENALIIGDAVDISEKGGLMIRLHDGSVEEFLAGDVSIGSNYYGSDN